MEKIRAVVFYKNYFLDFFKAQNPKVKEKILWTIGLLEVLPYVPETYLKHLSGTNGLYEIRIQSGSDVYRVFCFFSGNKLIVALTGFQKKTQKTPPGEIKRALKIKGEYENER